MLEVDGLIVDDKKSSDLAATGGSISTDVK